MRTGIVVTDSTIKIVTVIGSNVRMLRIPLEKGIIEDGSIKDPDKLKSLLLKASSQPAFAKGEVILSVSERHIFSKSLIISDHGTDLEEKIHEEIEDYVPSGAASYADWQVLEKGQDFEHVYVASISSELLDSYLGVFASASIHVVGIEPLAFSLARHTPRPLLQDAILPGKSKGKSEDKQKRPQVKQEVKPEIPTSALVISLDENEALLVIVNDKGHIELTSVLPKESLSQENDFLSEVSDMRLFYDRKSKGTKIGRIFLTGQGATDRLISQISTHLGAPCDYLRIRLGSIAPADALSFFPVFALSDLPVVFPKDHTFINLLPEEALATQEYAKNASYRSKLMMITALFFGACCLVYSILFVYLFWSKYSIDALLTKQKEAFKGSKSAQLRYDVDAINKRIATIGRFRTKEDQTLKILSFLSEKTPGGITITGYKIDSTANVVFLNGTSFER